MRGLKHWKKLILFVVFFVTAAQAQDHPKLILTKKGVQEIRNSLGTVPIFDQTLEAVKKEVDEEIATGIHIPEPKDFSGGYSHERHKRNFFILQKAGLLFQILEDEKYANYIRESLMAYAQMYPKLPLHPQERSYARGKIFWQCLNDANWLVYVSQAYDCIYDWLPEKEVEHLNTQLFRPFADFLSIGNPQFFNRVHNHSTWGNVAVGMIGLVMDDGELIDRALYGTDISMIDISQKDNDGGSIIAEGQKAGFLANLEEPFSPDGYYTEGPYYQRYAMYPFMVFAVALENVKPELNIFEYKNGVLAKAVSTLINLTDANGDFYPINDAQKGMSYFSRELVSAVNIAYHYAGNDPQLLSIAAKQNKVLLDDSGFSVAKGLRDQKAEKFNKSSMLLSDGPKGKQGGLAIMRSKVEDTEINLLYKFSAQGLSHGHYDKLSYSLYVNGDEIFQDYGLARFVNIEQKGGGNYLKENKTWAKQSIAHNTVIQNERSHFEGKYELGSKNHSDLVFADLSNANLQVVCAREKNAYPGTEMKRTLALIKDDHLTLPFVLDVFHLSSESPHQYDLPFYYKGQLMSQNFDVIQAEELRGLGTKAGYQHLWLEAQGKSAAAISQISWLESGRFHTLTLETGTDDQVLFCRIGANDPEFNLRRDPALIQRRTGTQKTVFVSLLETHGHYDPVSEIASNAYSGVQGLKSWTIDETYFVCQIDLKDGQRRHFILSLKDYGPNSGHELEIEGESYSWEGPFCYK